MESKLTTLAKKHGAKGFDRLSSKSISWLKTRIFFILNKGGIRDGITRETSRATRNPLIGRLYFYHYQPKHALTLPYYDTFPLVLILQKYDNGFLGLNFHYLPVLVRAAFLDQLLNLAQYNGDNEILRLKVTYDILSATQRYKAFKPCLKQYLYGYMGSNALLVEPNEWETAIFLPVEQFKKQKKEIVYQDSLIKMFKDNE